MKINCIAKFNLIGVTASDYTKDDGSTGISYRAKVDQPDGVDALKIDKTTYDALKDLAPMTPIICDCLVNPISQYANSRFTILRARADVAPKAAAK